MAKPAQRAYSLYNKETLVLLANMIRLARKDRGWTAQETAERAGISRGLLQRIEKGDPKCEIGATFEVATLLGIQLFNMNPEALHREIKHTEEKLSLLPKSVRKVNKVVNDDF